jgi:hypothetical protein
VAKTKSEDQEQAVRQAIDLLVSQGRDVTTSAILSRLHTERVKAKASDIHASAAWKELLAQEKGQGVPPATQPPRAKSLKPQSASTTKETTVTQPQKKPNFPSKTCPNCGALIHARSLKHEACGWVMAAATSAPSARAAKKPARPQAAAAVLVGGISLDEIAAVKNLVDRIGAEKVRDLAAVLEK